MSAELREAIRRIDNSGFDVERGVEIFEELFVIIPRSALPTVKRSEHDKDTYYTGGENIVYTSEENARQWVMRDIAVWQFIANEGKARATRRDDLARELVGDDAYAYRFAEDPLKTAIDRIIELEATK